MNKVGIITLYKDNRNYGGLLQAYALNRAIDELGFSSEILNYVQNRNSYRLNRFLNLGIRRTIEYFRNKVITVAEYRKRPELGRCIRIRNQCLHEFETEIPHSGVVSDNDISSVAGQYSILVCGSDQIWNPGLWSPVMFLDIPGFSGRRFSYAASIGRSMLTDKEKNFVSRYIGALDAISVRETSAANLIQAITDKAVKVVLDPIFLLGSDKWLQFAKKPENVPDEFVFSFFLGSNKGVKKKIYEIYNGVTPIITIPHLQTGYKEEDEVYSDIQLYKIGPREWVWMILNAEMVFTDSFHGTAFSVNLGREFCCFPKGKSNDSQSINSRLLDLLRIFRLEERYICNLENFEKATNPIDKKFVNSVICEKKRESFEFLNTSLNGI